MQMTLDDAVTEYMSPPATDKDKRRDAKRIVHEKWIHGQYLSMGTDCILILNHGDYRGIYQANPVLDPSTGWAVSVR